jgi:hypothetical protein
VATYSYTTTPAEDTAIAAKLAVVNATRAAAQQAPQNAGQMLLDQFKSLFSQYASDQAATNTQLAQAGWLRATPAQQATAAAALGVTLT